jgi:glycosyltransferase involved in cell wall biosynthesis
LGAELTELVSTSQPLAPLLKVLVLLPYEPAAFMQADVEILSRHFDVDVVVHNRGKKRLFLGVLRRLLLNPPDVLVMWFIVPSYALAVTLMAKALGVRVVFMTGGYDVVSMPRIGFGAMRFPLFRLMIKPTLALADLALAFSRSAQGQVRKYARPRRLEVLYPGVDTSFFAPGGEGEREPLAVTVSPVTESSIVQKGLRAFVQAAEYAPEMRFVLVGRSPDESLEGLREIAPPNVEFVERFIPAEHLRELYRKAACYVQASVHEGFGIAVAEAMACGAVPVVTRRFSLPEVTGGLGEYVPLDDAKAIAEAARRCVSAGEERRGELRNRMVSNFTVQRRERELVDRMLELVPGRRRLSMGDHSARPVKLDLGCGSLKRAGFLGIDARPTEATAIVADAQALPVERGVVDEVYATCLLEHFDSPSRVLDEVHRVLKPTGRAVFRLPNLGTYSSHLDTTCPAGGQRPTCGPP